MDQHYGVKMRRCFADLVYEHMRTNGKIWIITGDMGYKMWDQIRIEFPDRFVNTGAAEQAMLDISIGLALEGKIPIVFSITPFLLYRPFESIRNYINRENIPVKLVGSGRNKDYYVDGFSHWAEEDKEVMMIFKNICSLWPETNEELSTLVSEMITNNRPYYINLKK
jgi:transketolase